MSAAVKVGANLRRARLAAGISQEECAFRAELHPVRISTYETGIYLPRVLSLLKVAGACGVPAADLLDGIAWAPGDLGPGRLVFDEEGS